MFRDINLSPMSREETSRTPELTTPRPSYGTIAAQKVLARTNGCIPSRLRDFVFDGPEMAPHNARTFLVQLLI